MRTWLRGKVTLLFLTCAVVLAGAAAAAIAAELVTAEVDADTNATAIEVEQGKTANFNIQLSATGNLDSATQANPATAAVHTSYSLSNPNGTVSKTSGTFSSPRNFWSDGSNGSTWTDAPTPYSVPASVTVGSNVPVGTYTYTLSTNAGTTQVTNQSGSGGKLSDSQATTITVKVVPPADSTPPVITKVVTGTLGNNGWYTSNVGVDWTVTDSESAISSQSGCADFSVTSNQQETTYTCTATSAGGTSSNSVAIKRDATAPTSVATTLNRVADHNGWYNAPVGWTTNGNDATSGIASCDSGTYNGPDGTGLTVSGKCTDNAGNASAAAASAAFKYDNTDPSANATPSRAADLNGWYNAPFSVSFSGTDATSGPVTCDANATYNGPDGTGKSVSGSCADQAGNTASATYNFKYDDTDPSANATPSRSADQGGWYNHAFSVNFSGTDATSGPVSCSPTSTTYGDDASETDGASKSVSSTCTDQAGNTASATYNFDYDATKPNTTATPSRGPDHNGWYNHAVTFSFSGTDATSGIDTCSADRVYDGPDGTNLTVDGTCTDGAGNTSEPGVSSSFDYDDTAPNNVSGALNRSADHNGWYNHAVGYQFTGDDATSDIDSCTSGTYSGPDSGSASVNGSCTDNAGNSTNGTSSAFNYDATGPTNVSGAPVRPADHNGWYTSPVNIDFSGDDTTSNIDSCSTVPYNGPDGNNITVNGSCTDNAGNSTNGTSSAFNYDATAPSVNATPDRSADSNGWYNHAVTVSFSGNDATSDIASCDPAVNYSGPDSGTASVNGTCTDNAGNQSASGTFNFKYDDSAPAITSVGATTTPNAAGWYKNAIDNTFKAADGVSGFSGHSDPYNFTQSSGTQQGNAVTIASGQVTDVAGNSAASINSAAFKIDLSDPTNVTFVGGPAANGSYDFGSVPAQPTCTAQDVPSGVKSCVVTGYSALVGTHTMTATATDNADRTATATRTYTVKAWTFKGFYQPVDMDVVTNTGTTEALNTVKAGSTVPLKFEVFQGATELTSTTAIKGFSTKAVPCPSSGFVADEIEFLTTGGTLLRYDTTAGQFIQNWQTPKKVGCHDVTMETQDGSKLVAHFQLR